MYNHNRPAAKGKGGKADNTPSVFGFFKRQESPIASICASGGSATREREAAHARALLAGGWKAASPSVHTVNAVNAASVNSSMSVANKLNSSSSSLAALASSVNLSNMVKHPKAPPKRTLPPSFDVFVPPPKRPSASVSQTSVKLGSQTTQNYPHSVSVSDSSSQLRGFQQNDPFADLDDDQLFGVPATVPSQSNPTTHHSYTSNYNPAASWSSNNVGNSYLKKSTDEFIKSTNTNMGREFKTVSSASNSSSHSQFRFDNVPTSSSMAPSKQRTAGLGVVNDAGVQLTREQSDVLQFVRDAESLFYTGSAGTGKSVLMREIIRSLRTYKTKDQIAVTAPTGIAASNIGGTTLHAFAGCGLAKEPVQKLVAKIKSNRGVFTRWRTTEVLIIDEISMVDGHFFDKLEEVARIVRDSNKPFGGIQLIICGDFMQLPPVSKSDANFAFEAKAWKRCLTRTILLKEVFRQKDPTFVKILNELRLGIVSHETENQLRRLSRPIALPPGKESIVPTELFSLRNQVDDCNKRHLHSLPGELWSAKATLDGDTLYADKLKECLAPERLELKVGAQVMLIKNMPDFQLVNGSLGTVVGFDEHSQSPVVDFYVRGSAERLRLTVNRERWSVDLHGAPKTKPQTVARVQYPLLLAYALSIHKSQGQTLEFLTVDLGRVFEKGQSYVALSRAVSMDGLRVLNFAKDKVMAHPKVVQFNRELLTL